MVNQTFVPKVQRGPQLTFQETGNQNTFMFAQSNTFIQIDGDMIQTFQLRFVGSKLIQCFFINLFFVFVLDCVVRYPFSSELDYHMGYLCIIMLKFLLEFPCNPTLCILLYSKGS